MLVTAVTLSTSFTASTNVPTSNAGTSRQARLVSQLAPAGCFSLSLTSLVVGSGAISNGQTNTLILGSAGADAITDTGNFNCIVSGGGTDSIIATATDICIGAGSPGVAKPCGSPSNGVTAAPTSDDYNNYGGQERLAITNAGAITALVVTVKVAATPGISFNSQANSLPGGAVTQSSTTTGGVITYSWVLSANQTIPAGYRGGVFYAQFNGTGTPHPASGDTWSITSTSTGTTSTLTGTF